MWRFIPVRDDNPFLRVFQHMQHDIVCNNFDVNPHANERIKQRGVNVREIITTAERGEIGALHRVNGQISCCFVYNGLVTCFAKPFGLEHQHERPTLTTVFRDSESYEPEIDELTITPRVIEKLVYIPGPERVVTKLPEDLSTDEFFVLMAKRRKAVDDEMVEVKRKIAELNEETAKLTAKLGELENVRRALGA